MDYIIWKVGDDTPSKKYENYEQAEREAKHLSVQHLDEEFMIYELRHVACVHSKPPCPVVELVTTERDLTMVGWDA